MNWQVNYALENIQRDPNVKSAQHIHGDAIEIAIQGQPNIVTVISADNKITIDLARQYLAEFPNMDFLCGYRKECVWEGDAISYLEANQVGWGSLGTLSTAIHQGNVKTASHKDYFFSFRLIRQLRNINIANIAREFDRVFTVIFANGEALRVGMIMEYEPTADAIRTFRDQFGHIDVLWCINPNGSPTQRAIEAGRSLECEVMKWNELKILLLRR